MSRGPVPTEVNVTACVAGEFSGTLPKAMLVALTLIVDTTATGLMLLVPVPVSPTVSENPAEELLLTVSWPTAGPAVLGSNCSVSVMDSPGFSVAGNVPPDTVKPVPIIDTPDISRGPVPTEVNVTACVAGEFSGTLPKAMLVALTLIVDTAAPRLRLYIADTPAEVAVNVTVCAVPAAETLAVNPALVAPAATITVAGTATAVLLLETLTLNPPVGAAAFRATMHVSFTIPLTSAELHESELKPGVVAICARVKELQATVPDSTSVQRPIRRSESADRPFRGLRPQRIFLRCFELACAETNLWVEGPGPDL
jgi:hypothetical protein